MDTKLVPGLDNSDITVKTYTRPKGLMIIPHIGLTVALLAFSTRANFQAGSLLYDTVLIYAPGFAQWCFKIQPLILYPLVGIHSGEAIYMDRSRLQRHNVPRFSTLWWKWVLDTFFGGMGAFVRFDRIVHDEKITKTKTKKH